MYMKEGCKIVQKAGVFCKFMGTTGHPLPSPVLPMPLPSQKTPLRDDNRLGLGGTYSQPPLWKGDLVMG